LIKGSVDVTKNSNTKKKIFNGVISGKGDGLVHSLHCHHHSPSTNLSPFSSKVAVLHGLAGTEKTLTAEAVAEIVNQPLYMIGSSDLGTTTGQMEDSTKRFETCERLGRVVVDG
jgi:AAA+ superfamily predicted ATPase